MTAHGVPYSTDSESRIIVMHVTGTIVELFDSVNTCAATGNTVEYKRFQTHFFSFRLPTSHAYFAFSCFHSPQSPNPFYFFRFDYPTFFFFSERFSGRTDTDNLHGIREPPLFSRPRHGIATGTPSLGIVYFRHPLCIQIR